MADEKVPDNAQNAVPRRYVVIDLEATCWENYAVGQNEIIEIGAVAYEPEHGVLGDFQTFVKPKLRPQLSKFCKQLTKIQQEDVDSARSFPEAFESLNHWAREFLPFLFVSWGDYDRKQFQMDCRLHGVDYPFVNHMNLKKVFADILGCQPMGMVRSLIRLSLSPEGTHHRALDDTRNITRILDQLIKETAKERWRGVFG